MSNTASESKQIELSLPRETLWDVAVGIDHIECDADLNWTTRLSEENHHLRAAMNLTSLERLRAALEKTPSTASPGDPVVLRAGDAVLLARCLLQRLTCGLGLMPRPSIHDVNAASFQLLSDCCLCIQLEKLCFLSARFRSIQSVIRLIEPAGPINTCHI
ncbi:hypothetical protein MITS9509_00494 [Synechococcus sp. MIT S9509]|nr:hypothetical protein MITS9509_00494 [Synechococcus sp. MIT S9509]